MNAIRAILRDFKVSRGIIPTKRVELSTGIVLEHYRKPGTKIIEVRLLKSK